MGKRTVQSAWELLDQALDVRRRLDSKEIVSVTAEEIKRYAQIEPRIAMKFDTRKHLPPVLRGSTVLPVRNGVYNVLPGDGYKDLPERPPLEAISLNAVSRRIRTLDWSTGPSSESKAIDMAFISGLLHEFTQDDLHPATIRGRGFSLPFDFLFRTEGDDLRPIEVRSVQIEVDAGFEGDRIYVLEAKMGPWDDFHIRQLYYPYRHWQKKVEDKRVTPIFLSYSNREYTLCEYAPSDNGVFQDLVLVRARRFTLEREVEPLTLHEALSRTKLGALPVGVPFPQADRLTAVGDVVEAVSTGRDTTLDVALALGVVPRQGQYYTNVAIFFGLLERKAGGKLSLTSKGSQFARASSFERKSMLLHDLASMPVFRQSLITLVEGRTPSSDDVVEWLLGAGLDLSMTTARRRAQTVLAWLKDLAPETW